MKRGIFWEGKKSGKESGGIRELSLQLLKQEVKELKTKTEKKNQETVVFTARNKGVNAKNSS